MKLPALAPCARRNPPPTRAESRAFENTLARCRAPDGSLRPGSLINTEIPLIAERKPPVHVRNFPDVQGFPVNGRRAGRRPPSRPSVGYGRCMINPMPAAEVEVPADLVGRLLAGQHPDLAGLPVEPLANGWDNTLFRLGDALVARLPRRALGASILVNEQRWLPSLAPRLPLPVPLPVRTGVPGEGYPWPWSVVPFLPGTPASDGPPFEPRRAAADLGGFFGALHVPAPPDAPANPFRGVPLERRAASFEKNLAALDATGLDATGLDATGLDATGLDATGLDVTGLGGRAGRDAVLAAWETALAVPPWNGPPLWLHGDPHPANILIRDGRVSGVIDFGDITAGDPASDLSLVWMLLPASCHGEFRAAYAAAGRGTLTDAVWARGRGWALNMGLVFLAWSADNPRLHAAGRRTLAAVLADKASR